MKLILKTTGWLCAIMLFWVQPSTASEVKMKIYSNAFGHEQQIPSEFTCEGQDLSPEVTWSGVPDEAKTLALIVDDPDAPMGTFVHWVVYNIPAEMEGLPEGVSSEDKLDNGMMQGINDFKNYGYGGPCPPRGHGTHHYYFRLYALDTVLDLEPGATKEELLDAMEGSVIDEAEYMGTYLRN
jgi:hypothetical protein